MFSAKNSDYSKHNGQSRLLRLKDAGKLQAAFYQKIGSSPFTHYTVNGFHFIGVSPDCEKMSDGYRKILPYLKIEIELAKKECGDRLIFVTTHNCAENTVYGSDDWGDKGLFDLFSQYPNLINFAGHLHYSLLDERSIWQGAFTAFGTQSTSYVELERERLTAPCRRTHICSQWAICLISKKRA